MLSDSASSLAAHAVVNNSDDCEYERGEMLFYHGANWIFENGDRIVHGQQAEVLGRWLLRDVRAARPILRQHGIDLIGQ